MFLTNAIRPHFLALSLPLFLAHFAFATDPVSFAIAQLGKPYLENSNSVGPEFYDCSGLTKAAYNQVNISLPHRAAQQAQLGQPVGGPFEPGDLLFFNTYGPPGIVTHVGIYVSGTTMIDADSYDRKVSYDNYQDSYWGPLFLFARRYLSTTGTINVKAMIDGNAWASGPRAPINYSITSPNNQSIPGTTDVPFTSPSTLQPGLYTLVYSSDGPANAVLSTITCSSNAPTNSIATPKAVRFPRPEQLRAPQPSCTAQLGAGQTLTFTLQFTSNPVYSQMSWDVSASPIAILCPLPPQGPWDGTLAWDWQQPTGNPAGKLGSLTLKLMVQSTPEFLSWSANGCISNGGTSGPGDFGQILVWSQQLYTGGTIGSSSCLSTNAATVSRFTPDTWQDFTFSFDPNTCPIDFSKGDQIYAIYTSDGAFYPTSLWGWGVAYNSAGELYAIITAQ